jgi:hypothetical protein
MVHDWKRRTQVQQCRDASKQLVRGCDVESVYRRCEVQCCLPEVPRVQVLSHLDQFRGAVEFLLAKLTMTPSSSASRLSHQTAFRGERSRTDAPCQFWSSLRIVAPNFKLQLPVTLTWTLTRPLKPSSPRPHFSANSVHPRMTDYRPLPNHTFGPQASTRAHRLR